MSSERSQGGGGGGEGEEKQEDESTGSTERRPPDGVDLSTKKVRKKESVSSASSLILRTETHSPRSTEGDEEGKRRKEDRDGEEGECASEDEGRSKSRA